jgi:hypothetical protein
MREREASELQTLRELAKAFDDLCGDLPKLEKYRRDGRGRIGYTPHTLALFRTAKRTLNEWKRTQRTTKKEDLDGR